MQYSPTVNGGRKPSPTTVSIVPPLRGTVDGWMLATETSTNSNAFRCNEYAGGVFAISRAARPADEGGETQYAMVELTQIAGDDVVLKLQDM
jgi:hypothetical protein